MIGAGASWVGDPSWYNTFVDPRKYDNYGEQDANAQNTPQQGDSGGLNFGAGMSDDQLRQIYQNNIKAGGGTDIDQGKYWIDKYHGGMDPGYLTMRLQQGINDSTGRDAFGVGFTARDAGGFGSSGGGTPAWAQSFMDTLNNFTKQQNQPKNVIWQSPQVATQKFGGMTSPSYGNPGFGMGMGGMMGTPSGYTQGLQGLGFRG